MALIPKAKYPGQVVSGDAAYPQGRARNVTVPGDGTGTPFEQDLVNDVFGFQQALLAYAAIEPHGVPDKVGAARASQYRDALQVARALDALSRWDLTTVTGTSALKSNPNGTTDPPLLTSLIKAILVQFDSGEKPYVEWSDIEADLQLSLDSGIDATGALGPIVSPDFDSKAEHPFLFLSAATGEARLHSGTSWFASGSAAGGLTTGGYFSGTAVVAGLNKIYTGPGTWTPRAVPGGWAAVTPRRFATDSGGPASDLFPSGEANPNKNTVALLLPQSGATFLRTEDGTTWAETGALTSQDQWRAAYCRIRGKWLAGGKSGKMFTSVDGNVWTQVATQTFQVHDIVEFGGLWVVSVFYPLQARSRIYVTPDGYRMWEAQFEQMTRFVSPPFLDILANTPWHLMVHRSRVVASRVNEATSHFLEVRQSGAIAEARGGLFPIV